MYIKKILKIMLLTIAALIVVIPLFAISFCPFSAPSYKGPITDHFDGEKFINYEKNGGKGFADLIKWQFNRDKGPWKQFENTPYGPRPMDYAGQDSVKITFINHSTVLIQVDSLNIITDPVYSFRVSPVSFTGPSRHRNPGIKFEDLPKIDIVLISHNHYDHLDIETVKALDKKFHPHFLTPLGNKAFLEENGIKRVTELDWWNEVVARDGRKITFVPARHFSGRGTCDRNETLWGGFVINTAGGPIYFAGDTGFGSHFQKIFDKFGPMRFSMIPIGAYRPTWFMSPVHVTPEEAVKAHIILESKQSMGIHFGTFAQADDGQYEPITDLAKALKRHNLRPGSFFAPEHGKGFSVPALKF